MNSTTGNGNEDKHGDSLHGIHNSLGFPCVSSITHSDMVKMTRLLFWLVSEISHSKELYICLSWSEPPHPHPKEKTEIQAPQPPTKKKKVVLTVVYCQKLPRSFEPVDMEFYILIDYNKYTELSCHQLSIFKYDCMRKWCFLVFSGAINLTEYNCMKNFSGTCNGTKD